MNIVDDYEIQLRDYCRMNLYLVGGVLNIMVPLKIVQKDTKYFLYPLYKRDKIFDQPIMNAKFNREENTNINHTVRHVI